MSREDKTIVCVDCGAEFTFTAAEQQLFADKGFTSDPKRCKTCREARKASQTSGNRTGGNAAFSSGNAGSSGSSRSSGSGGRGAYSGGRGSGGGGRSYGGGDRAPRQMFPATCASCGKPTEVPFKPTGSRPVYCRECFQSQK